MEDIEKTFLIQGRECTGRFMNKLPEERYIQNSKSKACLILRNVTPFDKKLNTVFEKETGDAWKVLVCEVERHLRANYYIYIAPETEEDCKARTSRYMVVAEGNGEIESVTPIQVFYDLDKAKEFLRLVNVVRQGVSHSYSIRHLFKLNQHEDYRSEFV